MGGVMVRQCRSPPSGCSAGAGALQGGEGFEWRLRKDLFERTGLSVWPRVSRVGSRWKSKRCRKARRSCARWMNWTPLSVSTVYSSYAKASIEVVDGIWSVLFYDVELGRFDERDYQLKT